MSEQKVLARVSDLTVRFGEHVAVAGVSFEVRAGECVALVGESGSGKSLTAKALLGLLPATAQQGGTVYVGGAHTLAPARGAAAWNSVRGNTVALIPQDALGSLDPLRRIELEVGDALRLHRIASGGERRQRVIAALESAAMPAAESQLRKRSDELSGGLRQRALIASALIAEPELIVADEPTTALDAGHRGRVLSELRRRVDAGAGAVLISHDLASGRDVADRVLVMRDGRVIEAGSSASVLGSPAHPFTQALIAASPVGKRRLPRTGAAMGGASSLSTAASIAAPASVPVRDAGRTHSRLDLRSVSASYGA
ncbi:MAG: ABC transporter ATP-binding protein, partial [Leucobacter sp.]|nr:ABC transporter ATP-binding protein [Leucobacter sp.]